MSAVYVTGRGLVTAAGFGFPENWRALARGQTALKLAEDGQVCGRLTPEDAANLPDRKGLDRAVRLGLAAAREAALEARLPKSPRTGVVMGTARGVVEGLEQAFDGFLAGKRLPAITSPKTPAASFAAAIAADLGLSGPGLTVSATCTSGLAAIGVAYAMIQAGQMDHALVGAAESATSPFIQAMLRAAGVTARKPSLLYPIRPFHPDANGLVVGEGAACLALSRDPGEMPFARVTGYGAHVEAGVSPTGISASGEGLRQAALTALAGAGLAADDLDLVCAHGAGTRTGDAAELAAIRSLFSTRIPPIAVHKWLTGHLLGASSAAAAAFATAHMESGLNPDPPYFDGDLPFPVQPKGPIEKTLVLALGFGGLASALVLEAP